MKDRIFRYMAVAVAGLLLQGGIFLRASSYAWAQSQKTDSPKEVNRSSGAAASSKSAPTENPLDTDSLRRGQDQMAALQGSALASDKSLLSAVRFLSWANFTRVMVQLSKEVKYEVRRLKEDPAKGLPPRIYIDIQGARLALDAKEPITVEDGLLRQVRIGQFSHDVVRVVLDMNHLKDHNVFLLPDPYRLIIDLRGEKALEALASMPQKKTATPAVKEKKPPAPVVSGIRKIVLDPGHGGKDPGAIGVGGIAEKDLVLAIAKKLAVKLKKEMNIEVVLTRKDDRYVPLEDRTAIANAEEADLFISLHMNASPNVEASGLETYYLDNTTDEASMRLAARENSTSRKNISDLQFILSDMTQNMKLDDSITLAHRLQKSLVTGMSRQMGDVKDLGVKKALFYVLVGARMPSVLVEMFFITNRVEGRAMNQEAYQNAMVEALLEGIGKYNQGTMAMKTL